MNSSNPMQATVFERSKPESWRGVIYAWFVLATQTILSHLVHLDYFGSLADVPHMYDSLESFA